METKMALFSTKKTFTKAKGLVARWRCVTELKLSPDKRYLGRLYQILVADGAAKV